MTVNGWEKINKYHANNVPKKARVAMLILDKVAFRIKSIIKDKVGRIIMIKGSMHQKGIAIMESWVYMCLTRGTGTACIKPMGLRK